MRSPRLRPARAAGPSRSTDATTRLKGVDEALVLAPSEPCHGGAPPIPVASRTPATWTNTVRAQIARSTGRHAGGLIVAVSINALGSRGFHSGYRFPAFRTTPGTIIARVSRGDVAGIRSHRPAADPDPSLSAQPAITSPLAASITALVGALGSVIGDRDFAKLLRERRKRVRGGDGNAVYRRSLGTRNVAFPLCRRTRDHCEF